MAIGAFSNRGVRVFDVATGAPRCDFPDPARGWRTGELVHTFAAHARDVNCVAYRGDGTLASASSDGTVRLWRDGGEAGLLIASTQDLQAVAWSCDGTLLAAAGLDRMVRVFRTTAATAREASSSGSA